jgi:hypothetical protein
MPNSAENYIKEVARLIPGEFIAAYLALLSIAPEAAASRVWYLFGCIFALLIVQVVYLVKLYGIHNVTCIALSVVSFIVWTGVVPAGPYAGIAWFPSYLFMPASVLISLIAPLAKFPPLTPTGGGDGQ